MDFTDFDNLVLLIDKIKENISEQYDNENIRLNDTILELTALCREQRQENVVLQKQVDDNTFNENNYNKVSILRTLSKENDDLKKQNAKLLSSLNYRQNEPRREVVQKELVVLQKTTENIKEETVNVDETVEVEETSENVEETVEVDETLEVDETVKVKETVEVDETVENIKEEEVNELDIIKHKGKEYFVIENMVYRKKVNGDKGKKVGKLVDGKIKFIKKK